MAITNDKLDKEKVFLYGVKEVTLIPYAEGGDALGTNSFTFDSILEDTVSLQQDENTTNERGCETRDEPLIKNIKLGAWQFAMTSLDFQAKILTNFGGWTTGETDEDIVMAPTAYKPVYALAIIKFNSSTTCVVCPKLQIDARATLASLKTSSGECPISGTAIEGDITVDSKKTKATIAFVPDEKLNTAIPELAGA